MRCALFVNTALLGLLSSLLLACSKGQVTHLNNTRNTGDLRNDRWIALEGSIVKVRTLRPGGPAGAAAQPLTVADISYLLPCWAKLEEGFPKTNVTFDPKTGVHTIGFLALARDNRQPGGTSCRGLANITLKDVFVSGGILNENSVTIRSLTVADKDVFLEGNDGGDQDLSTPSQSLVALEGSIVKIRTLAPGGPAGAAAQPLTVADISYLLPCWAKLEEGFPKTNVTFDPKTGVHTIGFLALARDNRQPGGTSCRGLANITLKDVFVAAGIWSEDSVTMKNLTVADRDLFQ